MLLFLRITLTVAAAPSTEHMAASGIWAFFKALPEYQNGTVDVAVLQAQAATPGLPITVDPAFLASPEEREKNGPGFIPRGQQDLYQSILGRLKKKFTQRPVVGPRTVSEYA